jgi:hypothetical protein
MESTSGHSTLKTTRRGLLVQGAALLDLAEHLSNTTPVR